MSVVAGALDTLWAAVREVGLHVIAPVGLTARADVRAVIRTAVPGRSGTTRTVALVALVLAADRVHGVSAVATCAFVLSIGTIVACRCNAVRARALDALGVPGCRVQGVARVAGGAMLLSVCGTGVSG